MLLPQIGLQAGTQHSDSEVRLSTPQGQQTHHLPAWERSAGIALSQPLYRPANLAQYRQGQHALELAQAQEAAAEQSLLLQVAQAYVNVLQAHDVLQVQTTLRHTVTEQAALAQRNFDVGLVTITDVREAQARLDAVQAQWLAARNEVDMHTLALQKLTGWAAPQPWRLPPTATLPTVTSQQRDAWLADLPHSPWLAQPEFALEQLAERLQTYQADCRQLLALDEQIRHLLGEIHAGGLTKYQFVGEPESEIVRLVEFAHHLPQEAEALEKKVRSAVVNVAACLRELRDGLFAFKRRMREFNRKISGRQLSDLAVFKIEPEDETILVEAIELLISTAATVDSGETFELFNQQSVLDDDQLNRAKTLLIEEGNARHGMRVADLFRLRFWVGKADREPEAFDDLDSAASNGTVLMAKLVTGLAMLHLMQDQRRPIQGICYLDEALALDARNQRSLIDTAAEFGFSLIFASPAPLTTVRYCVPIHHRHGSNQISRFSWQIIEPMDT